jgi:hypothetical protein
MLPPMLSVLLVAGSIVPLAAMIAALFAAAWLREGRREAPARRSNP